MPPHVIARCQTIGSILAPFLYWCIILRRPVLWFANHHLVKNK